uniref:Complement C1q-like protein 2 n=1 Tax=Crassostrea virginica TaxID=6565 RepID=A0A8B8AYR3_CRAVI|nr:complement C1q-like protein 2 [Crassostrea virginica]
MKLIVGILLYCLFLYVRGKQSTQQKKLESLKSLIFNNAKATVTLNSTDLKQLLSLSRPSLGKANTAYSGRKIGFYVSLKSSSNYGSRQTVKFDSILVNDGNGYDDRTGVFTCPVAGTYMFVVDVQLNKYAYLSIMLNKTAVARLYRDSKAPILQASRTILLKLKQGDHIKIVCENNNVNINGNLYSGFTGTFLY